VCDVAVVAAVSAQVAVAFAAQPTCPEPGRTAETPLLIVTAPDEVASTTVVELTVLVIAEDNVPLPVAVTTVVVATVGVTSFSLKYATLSTKCELSSVNVAVYEPPFGLVPARIAAAVIGAKVALVLFVVRVIVWFGPRAAPVLSVAFIKRPTVAVEPVTVAPVTVARVTVVGATAVATVNVVLASPAAYVASATVGAPVRVDTRNVYEPATSGWNTTLIGAEVVVAVRSEPDEVKRAETEGVKSVF